MSSLETRPDEVACGQPPARDGLITLITPREVPLGGPRAMRVRRTLPARGRTMIGAWCFVDHYGPDEIATSGGMVVPPHPHTALQTVSWLFSGLIEHRDSTGVRALVRPGELNLMTAGYGVSHSEVSVTSAEAAEGGEVPTVLHGAQLWVALPTEHSEVAPAFEHFAPEPLAVEGARVSVFLGELGVGHDHGPGASDRLSSPVTTYTPLLGAEIVLEPGAGLELGVDPDFEHGVLVDHGSITVGGGVIGGGGDGEAGGDDGVEVARAELAHLASGRDRLRLVAGPDPAGTRVLLIGGPPFGEQIVMWWNFIGRSHDDIVAAREAWQTELSHAPQGRFGAVDYPDGTSLPAPDLPPLRLRPRG
ncbi:pirin family protein [Serinicoccus profundi]|uniref:pirin family protein n=1 Tax=Serinicoccus profundi TaxID=1078471 RepID=UPI000255EEE1|nr:pirin family protein [Serinicoccus profundi]